MDIFDEIRAPPFDMQQFSRRAVKLDTPITFDEYEFDHALIRAEIDPFEFERKRGRDLLADNGYRFFVQNMHRQPIRLVC